MQKKAERRIRRHKRVRARVFGTVKIPRLCVFRSNKHIYAQLINDEKGETLAAASDLEIRKPKVESRELKTKDGKEKNTRSGKVVVAFEAGRLIAEKALQKKIEKVVFDRGGYKYHGRVKALAEGAREAGLVF